jgi:hypothetical protein
MPASGPDRPAPTWLAAGVCGLYWVLALIGGGRVPFLERSMFEFSAVATPAAAPLFRADGELADVHHFTDFRGLAAAAVDVDHPGYLSTVAHHFHDQRAWIADHQLPPRTVSGRHQVDIGLLILERGPDGRVTTTVRIDASGWARRVDE